MWNASPRNEDVKQTPLAEVESPALPAEERRVVAWVGKSVIFKGTLISSEDMTIDGQVEGTIEIRDQGLTIGPDADIRADIVARNVTIYGTVVGNIRASAKIDIQVTGRIDGDLNSPRIVLADGALVRGRVNTLGQQSETEEPRAHQASRQTVTSPKKA
jgi:cytoskeletal protein CcmA (bactofilin family)